VQRAPMAGRVGFVRYFKGAFHDARHPEASSSNEHRVLAICDRETKIVVRQIAGVIARRIVGWHKEGDHVAKGERVGMIRYGSRVEMYLPTQFDVAVQVGQHVKGGETIIGYRR
jgi:phosphatidylserine decarboxylase